MTVIKLCMLAILGVCAALLIKQWRSDFLPLLRIAVLVGFGILLLSVTAPLIAYLKKLIDATGIRTEHAEILLKGLGIAILTQCCADICKESGESGIASGVELTGKIEILLLCLPLFDEILKAARELLQLGN